MIAMLQAGRGRKRRIMWLCVKRGDCRVSFLRLSFLLIRWHHSTLILFLPYVSTMGRQEGEGAQARAYGGGGQAGLAVLNSFAQEKPNYLWYGCILAPSDRCSPLKPSMTTIYERWTWPLFYIGSRVTKEGYTWKLFSALESSADNSFIITHLKYRVK